MSVAPLIEAIRRHVQNGAPEMLPLFDIYANEARFGRQWLAEEISRLQPGDRVLEIGAGMLLLACQLRSEGIDITALEPVAEEFSHHLGIPTPGGKKWTGRLMRRRIERFHNQLISDPVAMWESLNWISVAGVRKLCHNDLHVTPTFAVRILSTYIERAMNHPEFQARHSPSIYCLLRRLDALGFFACLRWVPAGLMPVMDCRITHPESPEALDSRFVLN